MRLGELAEYSSCWCGTMRHMVGRDGECHANVGKSCRRPWWVSRGICTRCRLQPWLRFPTSLCLILLNKSFLIVQLHHPISDRRYGSSRRCLAVRPSGSATPSSPPRLGRPSSPRQECQSLWYCMLRMLGWTLVRPFTKYGSHYAGL